MKITKVCCQGCGADLQVDETVRYVTCNYCHARLEVVHDPSVTHTRLMEKLEKNTERMAGNLQVIELQNELARLDREWEQERESFMVTGKHGHRSLPSNEGSVISVASGVFVGLIFISMGTSTKETSLFVLLGVVVLVLSTVNAVKCFTKAREYKSSELAFRTRRTGLVRQIIEARRQQRAESADLSADLLQ